MSTYFRTRERLQKKPLFLKQLFLVRTLRCFSHFTILFALKTILENAHYTVTALTSGKEIVSGQLEPPDLFILDKRMPDMDGLEICRYLRTKPASKNIPIVIISASPKFGPEALHAGANDFLEKPFAVKRLLEMVSQHINKFAH